MRQKVEEEKRKTEEMHEEVEKQRAEERRLEELKKHVNSDDKQ